ncbi:MAG: hypothetical protein ACR2JI_09135 [Mycobacterium sp.]
MKQPALTSTGLALLAACAVTACSANTPVVGGMASSTTAVDGGVTECTTAALAGPATAAAHAMGADNLYTVDDLHCADGWAVTAGLLSSKANPNMGAPTSFVFEQEGQFWIPRDKATVCGTNPTTTTPPADAVIPAALFLPGCAAG